MNGTTRKLSNQELTENLRELSVRERKITAEVIAHIAEFMRRRLYLEYGCTSIFSYLTTKLKYAGSTAQNRIDAARLLIDAPALEGELVSGAINLAQISILARGFRQAETDGAHAEESGYSQQPLGVY